MIGHRLHHRLATFLNIALNFLLLVGCQSLAFGSDGYQVGVSNGNVIFGTVPVGASQQANEWLANHSSSPVVINAIQDSSPDFKITGVSLPLVVGPEQRVPFTVLFQPTALGTPTATIAFVGQDGQAYASLSATGTAVDIGVLSLNPSPVAFGNTNVGSNQTITVTLTNTGGRNLTITKATMSGAGFAMSNLALPLVLHAGGSASATVTFAPTAAGNFTGGVTFETHSHEVPLAVSLPFSGSGVTVTPGAVAPTPSSLSFGSIPVGNSATLTETLTNSGQAPITISGATASGSGFSVSGLTLPLTLSGGQSTSFTVVFDPTTSGAANGSISIASTGSNAAMSIPLAGTGTVAAAGSLTPSPSSLAFGSVQVGNSANLTETLTNSSGATITISQANLSGSGFSISGLTMPVTLTAHQSITFTATFAPTAGGAAGASLSVVSTALNTPLSIGLAGTGTALGGLAVSPASLSFGSIAVGTTSTLSGSLSASGASVTVNSAGLTSGEFAISGISLPITLSPGQSAPFTITFTPQSSGATSGSLSFASNASNSPAVESITGTGTAPIQHSVDLSWNASSDVAGYNVYRSSSSGGPYSMINTSLNSGTAFTDNTVVSGETYYYVTTAVDNESNESGYSNQAEAVIPTP